MLQIQNMKLDLSCNVSEGIFHVSHFKSVEDSNTNQIENKSYIYSSEHLQEIWLESIEPSVGIEPSASHIMGKHPNH